MSDDVVQQLRDQMQQMQNQIQLVQAQAQQQPTVAGPVHPTSGIALPTVFDDGNVVEWLDKFTVCAVANQWDDAAQLRRLPTLLSGRAFAIFHRLPNERKDTIAHIRASMMEAYLPPEARGAR